jgi:hypothetical protein
VPGASETLATVHETTPYLDIVDHKFGIKTGDDKCHQEYFSLLSFLSETSCCRVQNIGNYHSFKKQRLFDLESDTKTSGLFFRH